MLSLSDILNPDIKSKPIKRKPPVTYNYKRDVPTKIRPHDRHRQIVRGDPPVTSEIVEPCPCQTQYEPTVQFPFPSEELEKEFWTRLHLETPERDAAKERGRLESLAREAEKAYDGGQERQQHKHLARDADARKEVDNGEGVSMEVDDRDSTYKEAESEKEKEVEEESESDSPTRHQRSGGETAASSAAERAEADRQRREDESRIALAYKFKEWLLPPGSSMA